MIYDPYLPFEAKIVERIQEGPDIFTLRLRFTDPDIHSSYTFLPGQFNMLYLYGVGEVAISIVSDPESDELYDHTIRVVGRVTRGLEKLQKGDTLGVRGPFGRGWPMDQARGKDVVIITGGLGCAPVVSVVHYMLRRRKDFGHISMMQGVKHSNDLIYKQRFQRLKDIPNLTLHVAADEATKDWPWYKGRVVNLIPQLDLVPERTISFMCGPEMMMLAAVNELNKRQIAEDNLYLNMERNMHCGFGHCGHCQFGGKFICKDGPVFTYGQVKHLFAREGF